jgi:hypothetical protein
LISANVAVATGHFASWWPKALVGRLLRLFLRPNDVGGEAASGELDVGDDDGEVDDDEVLGIPIGLEALRLLFGILDSYNEWMGGWMDGTT